MFPCPAVELSRPDQKATSPRLAARPLATSSPAPSSCWSARSACPSARGRIKSLPETFSTQSRTRTTRTIRFPGTAGSEPPERWGGGHVEHQQGGEEAGQAVEGAQNEGIKEGGPTAARRSSRATKVGFDTYPGPDDEDTSRESPRS